MARAFIKNVKHNMFRDTNTYPWIEPKIDILTESVKKTGQWKNMICVPMSYLEGDIDADAVRALNDQLGLDGIYDGEVMIPWGHHRLEALTRMGEEFIYLTFEPLDEDMLLLQMILENHDDYSANMQVFLESIYQAQKRLTEKINEAGSYDAFKEVYPQVFKSKKAWEQMEAKGVTSGLIKNFLGETWDQYSIGYALSVIDAIEQGLYTQNQVCGAQTIRQMDGFDKLCREIYAQDAYPLYYKRVFVDGIAEMMADPKKGLTVQALGNARKNVKDAATDPLKSFKEDMKKAFNVVNAIDELTGAADSKLALADLPEHEGFKDFPDLAEVIKKIEKKRIKEAANEQAAAGGDAQDAVDGAEGELDGDVPSGSLDDGDVEGSAGADTSDEVTPDEVIAGFINVLGSVTATCELVNTLTDEQLAAAEGLADAVTSAFSALSAVGVRVTTKTALKKLVG